MIIGCPAMIARNFSGIYEIVCNQSAGDSAYVGVICDLFLGIGTMTAKKI